jgi:hypothetical protein
MKIAQHRTRGLAKIKQMTVTWRSSSRPRIILRVGCINLVMQQQPRSNHLRFRSSASNVKAEDDNGYGAEFLERSAGLACSACDLPEGLPR